MASPNEFEESRVVLHANGNVVSHLETCRAKHLRDAIGGSIQFCIGVYAAPVAHHHGDLVGRGFGYVAGIHDQTVQAPTGDLPVSETYAGSVEEIVLMREYIEGSRPWDRIEAFDLVARHVLGADRGLSGGAIADVCNRIEVDSASSMVRSLFSPQSSSSLVMRGDSETYDDPANSFVHLVVERSKGIPLTLAVIGSEVAEQLNIPLSVIGMPGHVLLQDGLEPTRFFDVFHGGVELDEVGCRDLYQRLTGLNDWNPDFLAPIGTAQQIFRMLNNLKSIYRRRSDVAHLRRVMALRALFPGVEAAERGDFARLMRETN